MRMAFPPEDANFRCTNFACGVVFMKSITDLLRGSLGTEWVRMDSDPDDILDEIQVAVDDYKGRLFLLICVG